jgi:hypothetical protein
VFAASENKPSTSSNTGQYIFCAPVNEIIIVDSHPKQIEVKQEASPIPVKYTNDIIYANSKDPVNVFGKYFFFGDIDRVTIIKKAPKDINFRNFQALTGGNELVRNHTGPRVCGRSLTALGLNVIHRFYGPIHHVIILNQREDVEDDEEGELRVYSNFGTKNYLPLRESYQEALRQVLTINKAPGTALSAYEEDTALSRNNEESVQIIKNIPENILSSSKEAVEPPIEFIKMVDDKSETIPLKIPSSNKSGEKDAENSMNRVLSLSSTTPMYEEKFAEVYGVPDRSYLPLDGYRK